MNPQMPLIGLSGRRLSGAQMGAPAGFVDAPADLYLSEYAINVSATGGLPVHLPLDADPVALVERLDGLLLAGGEDVTPARYGQTPGPRTGPSSAERDTFELALAAAAIARGIPVLGVCRGAQLLNVLRGGTLIQHLPDDGPISHVPGDRPRRERAHTVRTEPGSLFRELYGEQPGVNTFHHQAVDTVGRGIRVTAVAPDGVIEGLEFTDAPVVATQWHPEVFDADPVFAWLTAASRAFAAGHPIHSPSLGHSPSQEHSPAVPQPSAQPALQH
ncbi:gamma-glutamyl-gamma-aminobutyrate hydrolase family protein [Leucobacter chromiireducens]